MLKITFRRIIKSGYTSFRRNGWLSMATVMVATLMLFVLGNLVFLGALAGTILHSFESKIDVTVYFNQDATDDAMMAVKHDLEGLPEVKDVAFVSREQALVVFREKHKNNALIADALNELNDNPLQASLNVVARDPQEYGAVSDFLLKKNYPAVSKINYFENKKVIDRLGAIVGTVRGSGALLALFLAFIAVLVTFNTIRLAIYTMREEIGIMRLVGGTQWFIRGPFLVSGILYGLIAATVTTFIFFPITWLVSPKILLVAPDFNIFQYFLTNFWQFFAIMVISGVALGTISSFIAIRKYLKI